MNKIKQAIDISIILMLIAIAAYIYEVYEVTIGILFTFMIVIGVAFAGCFLVLLAHVYGWLFKQKKEIFYDEN